MPKSIAFGKLGWEGGCRVMGKMVVEGGRWGTLKSEFVAT